MTEVNFVEKPNSKINIWSETLRVISATQVEAINFGPHVWFLIMTVFKRNLFCLNYPFAKGKLAPELNTLLVL